MMNPISEAAKNLPGRWHKGDLHSGENSCGLGHLINAVVGEEHADWQDLHLKRAVEEFNKANSMMVKVAVEQYPDRTIGVGAYPQSFASFNDHPDTTESDVVAVMEKAAVKWDELA
jgi:hypothetical protein